MSTIAILFQKSITSPEQYKVHYLAEFWRQAGHKVVYLTGIRRFVPADVLLMHVDLSLVPADYLEFSTRYPKVINQHITDIRKSAVSSHILTPDNSWNGPVITKTNFNAGGAPETREYQSWTKRSWLTLEREWPIVKRIRHAARNRVVRPTPKIRHKAYSIYPTINTVPHALWSNKDVVVERFLPEMEDGLYHVRLFQVLGDKWISTRIASSEPIVKARNAIKDEDIEPHPIVERWREQLRLDYGKLDHVVVEGEPVLLDVNKTVDTILRGNNAPERTSTQLRLLAEGLDHYLR